MTSLSPDLLQDLLARLRRDNYPLGAGDFAAARALLLRLMAQEPPPAADDAALQREVEQRLQGMLGALLCRNAREQEAFPGHFQAWLAAQRGEVQPEHTVGVPSRRLARGERAKRRLGTPTVWVISVVLILSFLIGTGLWLFKPAPSPIVDGPVPANLPDLQDPAGFDPTPTEPDITQPLPSPQTSADKEQTPPDNPKNRLQILWQNTPPWLLWLLPPLLLLPWLIQRLNRRYLRRRLAAGSELARLKLHLPVSQLFQSAALGRTLQQLRRHETVPGAHLDIPATLERSIDNLGLFTPVNALAQRRPEYLVLVDRAAPGDQQTALVESLLARLEQEGVAFECWYFETDPRWCYPAADDFRPHALTELGARYADWRLLIFSPGHAFLDPLSGQPAEWLQQLAPWPRRALFTLEPANRWRYLQQRLAAEELLVAPADQHGLNDFIAGLHRERLVVREYQARLYPALLVRHPQRWLQRSAPPRAEITVLLTQLRAFLGERGFQWLAACAVYPELHWRLTLYLGEQLAERRVCAASFRGAHAGDRRFARARGKDRAHPTAFTNGFLSEERLARLTALPWLRYSYLPDWLRQALLDSLPRQEQKHLRKLFQPLLSGAAFAEEGEVETRITGASSGKSRQAEDRVCVAFLGGELGLPLPGVWLPDEVKHRRQSWLGVALSLMLGLVTAWQYGNLHAGLRDWLIDNVPVPMEKQDIPVLTGRLTVTTQPALSLFHFGRLKLKNPQHGEIEIPHSKGFENIRLFAGQWQVSVLPAPTGYQQTRMNVNIAAGELTELLFTFNPVSPDTPARLNLEITPDTAEVVAEPEEGDAISLDSPNTTSGTYQLELAPGRWTIQVDAFRYISQDFTVNLLAGEGVDKTISLEKEATGMLKVTINPPVAQLTAQRPGPFQTAIPLDITSGDILLPLGGWIITAGYEGYLSMKKEVTVRAKAVESVDFQLVDIETEIKRLKQRLDDLENQLNKEISGADGTGVPGYGPAARKIESEFHEVQRKLWQLTTPLAGSFRDRLKDGGQGPEMVVIPAGRFMMGSSAEEAYSYEKPEHRVEVARFALAKYEVTKGEFAVFVNRSGYRTEAEKGDGCYGWTGKNWEQQKSFNWKNMGFSQEDSHPVACISWRDAVEYTNWLSKQTGYTYRLPTEAEWEYAARAGTVTERYWGDASDKACTYANVADQTAKKEYSGWTIHECVDGYVYTAPVGEFRPNVFGLHDILGNVWEWTCSEWEDSYKGKEKECNNRADSDTLRVIRGGSWYGGPRGVRSGVRFDGRPVGRSHHLGFRPARMF